METKPLKQLMDKIGRPQLACLLGVDISTVYLWGYREDDPSRENGRRPSNRNMKALVEVAAKEGVELTFDYLVRL
jgi:hypothetical protein